LNIYNGTPNCTLTTISVLKTTATVTFVTVFGQMAFYAKLHRKNNLLNTNIAVYYIDFTENMKELDSYFYYRFPYCGFPFIFF